MEILHAPKKTFEFHCQGTCGINRSWIIVQRLIKVAGMKPARKGRIDRYPWSKARLGGRGFTIYQPLVESYCILDSYPDDEVIHVVLSTCVPERIDCDELVRLLVHEIGELL